jgi:hypothetical protein
MTETGNELKPPGPMAWFPVLRAFGSEPFSSQVDLETSGDDDSWGDGIPGRR